MSQVNISENLTEWTDMDTECVPARSRPAVGSRPSWSYRDAFKRNRGLITEPEQEKLRNVRVAIAGMGGVGGVHLITLARLGIGRFTIADPDSFEVSNTNRQYGAMWSNIGRSKAEVMAEIVRDINPEVDIRVIPEPVCPSNLEEFLDQADLLVDGIDAFHLDVRRILFRRAAALGIYAVNAGPVGFSTVWVTFAPGGMAFDEYFWFADHQSPREQFIQFIIGMAPKGTHRGYIDPSYVNVDAQYGPSASAACHLASGVLAIDSLKILLKRGRIWPAPFYQQFDPYVGKHVRGRLRKGNRGLAQRCKAWYLRKLLAPVADQPMRLTTDLQAERQLQ